MRGSLSMKEHEIKMKIEQFVNTLPETLAVIGYGSGVIPQDSRIEAKKQIDLFIVVDDKVKWNKDNIIKNPNYYSMISKLFFYNTNEKIQNIGAKICYIPFIDYNGDTYKIGVLDKKDLIADLEKWESFYLAGRFQKNILFVNMNDSILNAIKLNREMALLCALLLLPEEEKNLKSLYKKICSLSYVGDIRNGVAEDKEKIDNLVKDRKKYEEIYGTNTKYFHVVDDQDNIEINYQEIFNNIHILPTELLNSIRALELKESLDEKTGMEMRELILHYFKKINKQASMKQSIKGILTAGPVNSSKYVYAKLQKGVFAGFHKQKKKEETRNKVKVKK